MTTLESEKDIRLWRVITDYTNYVDMIHMSDIEVVEMYYKLFVGEITIDKKDAFYRKSLEHSVIQSYIDFLINTPLN
jgi:hypothetical protein